jgi:hypothetical protein
VGLCPQDEAWGQWNGQKHEFIKRRIGYCKLPRKELQNYELVHLTVPQMFSAFDQDSAECERFLLSVNHGSCVVTKFDTSASAVVTCCGRFQLFG